MNIGHSLIKTLLCTAVILYASRYYVDTSTYDLEKRPQSVPIYHYDITGKRTIWSYKAAYPNQQQCDEAKEELSKEDATMKYKCLPAGVDPVYSKDSP